MCVIESGVFMVLGQVHVAFLLHAWCPLRLCTLHSLGRMSCSETSFGLADKRFSCLLAGLIFGMSALCFELYVMRRQKLSSYAVIERLMHLFPFVFCFVCLFVSCGLGNLEPELKLELELPGRSYASPSRRLHVTPSLQLIFMRFMPVGRSLSIHSLTCEW